MPEQERECTIHKAAGVIIVDRKLLVSRETGKDVFVAPGGKVDGGETAEEAVLRELNEEHEITIAREDVDLLGTFYADAAGKEGVKLRMDVFMINRWAGEIAAADNIEEIEWVISSNPDRLQIGSIFEHDVIPLLVEQDLID